ncbi:MAG: hypothetical protein L0346_05775 [Chloroflexi bacterium]|nr:hypothetical protein [Chloroflexota bacterium]
MPINRLHSLKPWVRFAFAGLAFLTLLGCGQKSDKANTDEPLRVREYKNEAALDLLYPADWGQVVVSEGLLLFGEEEVLNIQEPGASMAVFRQTLADPDLSQALQHYLDSGPLASGYQVSGAIQSTRLDEREALQVTVEKEAVGDTPAMKSYIVAVRVQSGATYILTASAPQETWEENWSKFQVLIYSVSFNE